MLEKSASAMHWEFNHLGERWNQQRLDIWHATTVVTNTSYNRFHWFWLRKLATGGYHMPIVNPPNPVCVTTLLCIVKSWSRLYSCSVDFYFGSNIVNFVKILWKSF